MELGGYTDGELITEVESRGYKIKDMTKASLPKSTGVKVFVRIPEKSSDERYLSQWARVISDVDPHKHGGWCFKGMWLERGGKEEVDVGALVMIGSRVGTKDANRSSATVYKATADGQLEEVIPIAKGKDWADQIRDKVAELLHSGDQS